MDINTTDKVQVGDSTIGTSTSTTTNWQCPWYHPQRNIEYGWECPRCGKINAPWIPSCNCNQNWSSTWTSDKVYTGDKPEWWKDYVTCGQADDVTKNSTIYTTGGSDYKTVDGTYVNVGGTQSNKVDPNVTAWNCTNPNNCHTPHYTTETVVTDGIHHFYNLRTPKETK